MEKQKRGMLTESIKEVSKKVLGYEINQQELRFIPYLQYVLINEKVLDPNKISIDEVLTLDKWVKSGHVLINSKVVHVTKQFWDLLCEIMWLGYVDVDKVSKLYGKDNSKCSS